jgi:peptide/nickel transport system permease protein
VYAYALRRLLISIPLLLLSSMIVYALVHFAGDPLADLKGRNPPVPEAVLQQRRHNLYLDHSLPAQYWHWLTGIVRGDFGLSVKGIDIGADLHHRLGVTLRMVILAMLIAVILAMVVGVLSAVKQYSGIDYTATLLGFVALSMPVFWLAALLKEFLAIDINKWAGKTLVYTIGDSTPNLEGNFFDRFGNQLGHLILPTIALAAISYAAWSRYQRSSMLDVLNSDYIRLARAKGLSKRRVLVRHALRCALIPITTVVALDVGAILGGAVITERVFAWHGMGEMLLTSVTDQDVNRLLAWLMISAVIVVLFNLFADLLYAFLDPRIRYA